MKRPLARGITFNHLLSGMILQIGASSDITSPAYRETRTATWRSWHEAGLALSASAGLLGRLHLMLGFEVFWWFIDMLDAWLIVIIYASVSVSVTSSTVHKLTVPVTEGTLGSNDVLLMLFSGFVCCVQMGLNRCQQNALACPHFMIICDQRIRRGNRTPRSGSRSQDLIGYTAIYYVIQSWKAILQFFGVAKWSKCIDGVRQCLRTVKNSADVESNFTSVERLQLVLHGVVLDIQDEFSGHCSKLS